MGKPRQRRENDRHFFVELRDQTGQTRTVAVGNYWAMSDSDAVRQAEKEFPGLFNNMQTKSWIVVATLK